MHWATSVYNTLHLTNPLLWIAKQTVLVQTVLENLYFLGKMFSIPHLLSLPGCFCVISSRYRFANSMNAFIGLRAHEFAFLRFLIRVPLRFTTCSVDSSFRWYSSCSSFLWKLESWWESVRVGESWWELMWVGKSWWELVRVDESW